MHINKAKRLLALLALPVLTFFGCSETVDWEVEENQPQLVVEGSITSEYKKHHIFLQLTQDLYDDPVNPLSGALVVVRDGENEFTFTEVEEAPGRYESAESFAGEPGRTYDLEIQLQEPVGGELVFQASARMPHKLGFDSVKIVREELFGEEAYAVKLFGENPAQTVDFYLIHIYRNGSLLTRTIDEVVLFDDEAIEGFEFTNFSIYMNDEIQANDTIEVVVHSVVEDYYTYFSDLVSAQNTGDPFGLSGPPANVYGNISHEAFGYFYAAPVTVIAGIAEE